MLVLQQMAIRIAQQILMMEQVKELLNLLKQLA